MADEAYALGGHDQRRDVPQHRGDPRRDPSARAPTACIPGYGFFSENADFARAITDRGVAFIGPPPDAIEVMGDKVSSRKAALAAGVPMVPGHDGLPHGTRRRPGVRRRVRVPDRDQGRVRRRRPRHEGRARPPRRSTQLLAAAQREAKACFGRDEAYMERYLTWPRHVEMQIIGDTHGNVVWVGERDCSAQRRHQKLIEESPAPAFSEETPPGDGRGVRAAREGRRLLQCRHRRVHLSRTASSSSWR